MLFSSLPTRLPHLALAALAACTIASQPLQSAEIEAGQINGTITIDGQINEADWQNASQAKGFRFLTGLNNGTPQADTSFRVLVDDDAIYLAITCKEPKMSELKADPAPRDGSIFKQDCVEVFLDPTNTGTSYYQLALSANNDQWDQYYIEGGVTTIGAYGAQWDSAVHRGKDSWSAEIRLPFASLIHTRSNEFQPTWHINVGRERKPVTEFTTWSPLVNGFHESTKFGSLSGMPTKQLSQDIAILAAAPIVTGKSQDGHAIGSLSITTLADDQAAGEYRLKLSSEETLLSAEQLISIPAGKSEIVVDHITFPREGRLSLNLALGLGQTQALGVYYPLLVKYEPLIITLDQPFYSGCIFPGQQVDTILGSVTVQLSDAERKQCTLTLRMEGPGLAAPVTKQLSIEEPTVAFELPAATLTEGETTLTATISRNNKAIANTTQIIRKLPANDGSMVWIDDKLNLIVDGEQQMYRGWCGGDTFLVSQRIREKSPTAMGTYPAANFGKFVNVEPERVAPSDKANARKDIKPSQAVFDGIRRRVMKAMQNPDTWGYYLCDEPECRQISPVYLKYAYDFIKELDPYHPVIIISRKPIDYVDCADILSPHPYLSPTIDSKGVRSLSSPTLIRDQMRDVLAGGDHRKPAWFTPQAFSYSFNSRFADYPTFDEIRCMVWTGMVNGCKGLLPFNYHNSLNRPDVHLGYQYAFESLAALDGILFSSDKSAELELSADDDTVNALIRQADGKTLVAVVNMTDKPVQTTLSSPALKSLKSLSHFRESGTTSVSNSSITLELAPYGVRILTTPEIDQDLTTLAQTKELLARTNAERARPGNIMFGHGREVEFDASASYLRSGTLQNNLTDGLRDNIGWQDRGKASYPSWVEMVFPNFVPEFHKAVLSGSPMAGVELLAWKRGEWISLGVAPEDAGYDVTFELEKPLRTIKVRIEWPEGVKGAELYEVELYK